MVLSVEIHCFLLCRASKRLVKFFRLPPKASYEPNSTRLFIFSYLSDGVGNIVIGQGGWLWAVGSVLGEDLGNVGNVRVGGNSGGHDGGDGEGGELHFGGRYYLLEE